MGRMGRIGDRYRLVEKLGTGGMSVVWRGWDETLGRPVAVKLLPPQLAGNDAFRDRLRQEALAAARLCHPHITGIFDVGETPPYVVMELLDGETLSDRLSRTGPLTWRDALTTAVEVASALATAHARGVVHRDVTPANVMLTGTGARVVDFGISALIGQRDAAPDGSLLGTPAYLAPERLTGGPVSPATDVYALGLLLYRALTGRLPWPAGSTTEALRAHLYADPEPLPTLPGMPAPAAAICMSCLAKDPADRPAAVEVATRLGDLIGLQPIVPPVRATAPPQSPDIPSVPPVRRPSLAALALSWLGSPSLRVRAALRVGAALRLGSGTRSLGDGVFAVPRHGLPVAAALLAVAVVGGIGWASAVREPAEVVVGPAQAAAPVPVSVAGCKVRYVVKRDSGRRFDAAVTLLNTGDDSLDAWKLEFPFPGGQRLTAAGRAVRQNARRVVIRGSDPLAPGRWVTVPLSGTYRGTNPLPTAFTVDGHRCESQVVGATSSPSPPATESPSVREAAGDPKHTPTPKATKPSGRSSGRPKAPAEDPTPTRTARPKPGFAVTV